MTTRRRRPAGGVAPGSGDHAWLTAALAVLAAACAGGPPPAPLPLATPSEPVLEPLPETAELESRQRALISRLGALDLTPVATPAPPPPLPWIAPEVRLDPADPAEGTAFAVRLQRLPGTRRPLAVEGILDGRPLHFRSTRDGWLAVGALPVDAPGARELRLRFRISADSVEERPVPLEVASRPWPSTRLRVSSRTASPDPQLQERLRYERERIRATLERVTPEWLPTSGFDWPRRDRITSPFGQRRLLNGGVRTRHLGLDVAGRRGEPVRAAAGGRVALIGSFVLQGDAVYLDHGLGVYTSYFHLSRIDVNEGDRVEAGEVIGRVGATGRVTGPHLHWSLYVGGEPVDPASILGLELPASWSGPVAASGAMTGDEAAER